MSSASHSSRADSSMHFVDHDPVKQVLLSPEGMLTPQAAAEIEATIALLREHFERVRQHEVKRLRGRLGELSSTQENAIESLTHGIIDQILHAPITALKAASQDNESPAVIEIVHHVFSLGAGVERPEYDQAFGRPIE